MKKVTKACLTLVAVGLFSNFTAIAPYASSAGNVQEEKISNVGQPIIFEGDIDQVTNQIDAFYLRNENPFLRAASGTKWGEGTVVSDGAVGNYVTNYFWVKGSDMVSYNVVGKAQRNAVIGKYGSVNNNTSYKMKTTQHITLSGKLGNKYKTISADAWCYDRD